MSIFIILIINVVDQPLSWLLNLSENPIRNGIMWKNIIHGWLVGWFITELVMHISGRAIAPITTILIIMIIIIMFIIVDRNFCYKIKGHIIPYL